MTEPRDDAHLPPLAAKVRPELRHDQTFARYRSDRTPEVTGCSRGLEVTFNWRPPRRVLPSRPCRDEADRRRRHTERRWRLSRQRVQHSRPTLAAIAPGHSRILDILDADHEAVGVAEQYLGGVKSLGRSARIRDRGTRPAPPLPRGPLVGDHATRRGTRPPGWRPRCAECL